MHSHSLIKFLKLCIDNIVCTLCTNWATDEFIGKAKRKIMGSAKQKYNKVLTYNNKTIKKEQGVVGVNYQILFKYASVNA